MEFVFQGEVIEWRGPAPYYFVPTPLDVTRQLVELKNKLTYGWGVIPASVTVGSATTTTSLIPKNGSFYVPIKDAIRKPNQIKKGDTIKITLSL
jgi:hypothetical protein